MNATYNGWSILVRDVVGPGQPLMMPGFRIVMHPLDWRQLTDPGLTLPEYAAAVARDRFDRRWNARTPVEDTIPLSHWAAWAATDVADALDREEMTP